MPQSRVTLAQVAQRAGISVPTVSKALRGRTDVSTAVRRRVLQAADELGYGRRLSASPRLTAAPPTVDLVLSHVEGTWVNGVLSGVEEAATAAGVDVVITIARPGRDWLPRLLRRPSEGAIVVLVDPERWELAALRRAGAPVVLIDPMSAPPDDIPTVGVRNADGGRSAATHLRELGHDRLGVIAGSRNHRYGQARVEGFRAAAGDASVRIGFGNWMRAPARDAALEMLRGPHRPTAIFACSDEMALGVIEAAGALGLRIPDDLSLVGFDDVPEAGWITPRLTTVRQPILDMGATALRLLLAARRTPDDDAEAARVELPTTLVVRESTRRIRGADDGNRTRAISLGS